jgi:hypothetical protein
MAAQDKNSVLVLPYAIRRDKLGQATIETVRLGDRILRVDLPAVSVGQRVRLRNAGRYIDASMDGSDVYLLIAEARDQSAMPKRDVQMELPVNFSMLRSNAKRQRVNIHGRMFDVTIPYDAKPGQTLRMRNLAEICNGGHPGDILLRLSPSAHRFWTFWGLLDGTAGLSTAKVQLKFSIPFFFELGGEFEFRASEFRAYVAR